MPDLPTPDPASGKAREVTVPPDARAQSTLSRIDYENAILVGVGDANVRTGEQWARAVLEDAPPEMRDALTRTWSQLGLRLGPARSDRHVLGWTLQHGTPGSALLSAGSPDGLQGELLVESQPGVLLFASFIQQNSDEARAGWATVEDLHTPVMCQLIDDAVDRTKSV